MTDASDHIAALFQPARVGDITTAHRVVLAPLSRERANNKHVHTDLAVTYYAQRGSVPGTLLITEATFVAPYAGHSSPHLPGIWNEEQIAAWKRVSGFSVLSIAPSDIAHAGRGCRAREAFLRVHAAVGPREGSDPSGTESREPRLSLRLGVGHPVE